MTRVVLSSLRAHPLRLLATTVSVVLGVAFVAATLVVTDTTRAAFDDLLGDLGHGVDLVVRPAPDAGAPAASGAVAAGVGADALGAVAAADGVAAVAGVHEGPALLLTANGTPLRSSGFGRPPSAVSWIAEDALRDQVLRAGRAPSATSEVAVDEATAAEADLAIGDAVQVVFANAVQEATIVGTFGYGETSEAVGVGDRGTSPDTPLGAPTMAVDATVARQQLGAATSLRVLAARGADVDTLRTTIGQALGRVEAGGSARYEVVEGSVAGEQVREQSGLFMSFMSAALLVFAGVSLLVAGAIIFTTFTITVAQRTRQYALLRAVGASRGQVTTAVLTEALLVGLVGGALGLLVGLGLAAALRMLLDAAGLGLPGGGGGVVLQPRTILVALAAGVAVTSLAALVPAVRANRVAPVQALRDDPASTVTGSRAGRIRLGVATVVGVGGVAALATGLFAGDGSESGAAAGLPLVGVGAAGVLLATALFAPWFVSSVAHLIGAPVAVLRGLPGRLARENATRNRTRTAATAAALMIGVGLAGCMLVVAASLQASIDQDLEREFFADVQVDPANFETFPSGAAQALADVDGVAAVTAVRYDSVGLAGEARTAAGIQRDSFLHMAGIEAASGDLAALDEDTAAGAGAVDTDAEGEGARIALAADVAAGLDVGVGDTLPVALPGDGGAAGVSRARVVATYAPDRLPMGRGVEALMSYDRLAAAEPREGDSAAYVDLAGGTTLEEVRPRLQAALAAFPTAQVLTLDDARARTQAGADAPLGLAMGLLSLSVFIALFGVVNALSLSVAERTRELGLLRAVGMSRRQARTMIRWEAVIVVTLGALLGLAIGVLFGWMTVTALPAEFGTFALPVGQLILAVVVAGAAGVLAAVIPARRASRVNVLRAITPE